MGKQGRDMNGVPAPKAIDESIDERDSSGTTLHQELDPIGDQSDGRLWEALLKQAQANLETAHAIRLQS